MQLPAAAVLPAVTYLRHLLSLLSLNADRFTDGAIAVAFVEVCASCPDLPDQSWPTDAQMRAVFERLCAGLQLHAIEPSMSTCKASPLAGPNRPRSTR